MPELTGCSCEAAKVTVGKFFLGLLFTMLIPQPRPFGGGEVIQATSNGLRWRRNDSNRRDKCDVEGDEEKAAIKKEEEALLLNGRATKVALGFLNEKHSRVIDEQLEKRARERDREREREREQTARDTKGTLEPEHTEASKGKGRRGAGE